MKGKFIVLDGCDFSGKTTQIGYISEYLSSINIKHIITREPGGTDIGEKIRSVVLHGEEKLVPDAELLIFTALRCQHIQTKIKPLLEDGISVICDRFLPSTFVYQGALHGVENSVISNLHTTFVENFQPDATFILDVHPNISIERMKSVCKSQCNIYDTTKPEEVEIIRNAFLDFALKNKYHIIDANQSEENVSNQIINVLKGIF